MIKALLTAIMLVAFAVSPNALGQDGEQATPAFVPDDGAALSADKQAAASFKNLDQDIQDLKKEVLDLNTELFLLEEELLFPANTQVALFVSMDVGDFFNLDSVQIKVNDKEVANYLYTRREVDALIRGGVHRIYLGNLKVGEHELVAIFTGQGPHERDYRRGASLQFEKGIGPKYVQLEISDRELKQQPEFYVKEWE
ncbi:MAG: AraC family transcriptional regulator [Gammaproteobacteria bacterium]